MRWIKPPSGCLKINVDGALREDSILGGVGIIVRDELGSFVAARAKRFCFVFSPLQSEALAAREGLSLATEMSFNDIHFECDTLRLLLSESLELRLPIPVAKAMVLLTTFPALLFA